eukprot:3892238-Amphidinium_carterae.1
MKNLVSSYGHISSLLVELSLIHQEFAKFCDHLGYVGSRQTLFAHLDLADSGVLTFKNLKWLEESKAMHRKVSRASSLGFRIK